jgi:hypothetical protein
MAATLAYRLAMDGLTILWHDDARRIRSEWMTRFSPSGATLIVDHEGGIGFWDSARGVLRRFVDADHLRRFSTAGHLVFVGQGDTLIALSTEDGSEVWKATLPAAPVGRLDADVYAADEQDVVLHRHSDLVIALSMRTGRERYRLSGSVALHDRDVFLLRDTNGVTLRAVELGGAIVTLVGVRDGSFALSPDRRWLAVHEYAVTLWDLTTCTVRHTWSVEHTFSGFWFRDDSAALVVTSYQTQQSGNQDWNAEEIFDVTTGNCLASTGWWDQDAEPSPPRELAPGVVRQGDLLRVDGAPIPLPDTAVVCVAESGAVFIARRVKGHIELAAVTRATPG